MRALTRSELIGEVGALYLRTQLGRGESDGGTSRFILDCLSPEQTAAVAKEFKVMYNKVPGSSKDGYTVDHTAASYVFDKQGKLRLLLRSGQGVAPAVHDIKLLLG